MNAGERPLNFLVVEDDIPLSLFFKETLQLAGHRVFVAVNEHGAFEAVKQEAIDILICDYLLPGMEGSAIVDTIKEINKEIFCVLISGHHYRLLVDRELLTNADMVIAKPVLKEALNRIVKQYHSSRIEKTQPL